MVRKDAKWLTPVTIEGQITKMVAYIDKLFLMGFFYTFCPVQKHGGVFPH
jgi:hypothetical protein